ncbi:MAG: GDP-mannose 4,6-dehydratase [Proteobacteria bacterium]|nr:GDP-mannose 4,6-dehydratase [Pseudomonadota bacterium]
MPIFGDGSQTRSFCFVNDLIEALILLMKSPDDFVGPVNLGNPSEFSILELAETTINLTNSRSDIEFQPLPPDDPKQRQPDINLAKETLGWEPRVPLKEGMIPTIEYFETLLADAKGDSSGA